MDERYIVDNVEHAWGRLVEESGEVLAAVQILPPQPNTPVP
jgi:hypothetical protein